jgi:hypothetical protein
MLVEASSEGFWLFFLEKTNRDTISNWIFQFE